MINTVLKIIILNMIGIIMAYGNDKLDDQQISDNNFKYDPNEIKFEYIESFADRDNSLLKLEAKDVKFPLDAEAIEVIEKIKSKIHQTRGVGVAAPQIGYNLKIAGIYFPHEINIFRDNAEPIDFYVIINPKYEPIYEDGIYTDFEGCFSVRSIAGKVKRYNSVQVQYQDISGNKINKKMSGFHARVLQHEIDHLYGTLIIDRLGDDDIKGTLEEMRDLRIKELSPEKQKRYAELMESKLKRHRNEN